MLFVMLRVILDVLLLQSINKTLHYIVFEELDISGLEIGWQNVKI